VHVDAWFVLGLLSPVERKNRWWLAEPAAATTSTDSPPTSTHNQTTLPYQKLATKDR